MDPIVFELVIGKNYAVMPQQPGVLKDFKRLKVQGANYPAIIPSIGDQVDGISVDGITTEGKACLDDFEDDDYKRKSVSVASCDGREISALVYVAGPNMLLEDKDWNMEYWKLNYRSEFLKKLKEGVKVY